MDSFKKMFEEAVEENELEYMNSAVRVTLLRDVPKISAGGKNLENMKRGSVISVWQWVGEKLVAEQLAEYVDKPISLQQLFQIEWRERNSPSELQELNKFFYCEVRRAIRDSGSEEMKRKVIDIITLRMMKIVQLAAKRVGGDFLRHLTPEELALYDRIFHTVSEWLDAVGGKDGG